MDVPSWQAHSLAALSGIVFAALSTPAGSASVNVNDCFAEVLMIRHGLTLVIQSAQGQFSAHKGTRLVRFREHLGGS
ncbi:hypothetical protein M747DRAFT_21788 [Aspergillus niger ATCC 13496]|uniref:Uncharacterized protein n=1 Tax=Aspergillus niger ATCC 13496 TaxID=1353008 RepID=A0A370C126_ASPNG|nr:hypothetical protein M747DRAFT_21788 [Aspergillus niger ATCC 13496]